jgi:hypothetical protein
MADFIQNSQTKTAVRELASPIPDVAAFNTIVQSVITDNPFGCVAYMTAGENHAPVEKTREAYTRTGRPTPSATGRTGSAPLPGSTPA